MVRENIGATIILYFTFKSVFTHKSGQVHEVFKISYYINILINFKVVF